jgi:hypothetical protein
VLNKINYSSKKNKKRERLAQPQQIQVEPAEGCFLTFRPDWLVTPRVYALELDSEKTNPVIHTLLIL